ncbi:hypothetical protein PBY51_019626 [Eleginops maclovinus]|uniref:Uncharacterized protein n=1 Tax=Eleginops maclovinus TaxID=56733 RepID=A0AAN8AJW9_ELEMC|nr:hypothetical protein PBY51_019626 [Eleginops maclovinus]
MLDNKPPGGLANLFYHLSIPPSLNLSISNSAIVECQAPPWLSERRERQWTAAKQSPRILPTHALRYSCRLQRAAPSPGMSLSRRAPRREAQAGKGGDVSQPPCNRSTLPGHPPAMWSACWDRGEE